MKTLIKKADGSAVKSKLHAVKFLESLGIDKSELIEENGQFYYESGAETPVEAPTLKEEKTGQIENKQQDDPTRVNPSEVNLAESCTLGPRCQQIPMHSTTK